MSATLGLEPEDFRVLGRALVAFADGEPVDEADEHDREQAAGLYETLLRWGFVSPAVRHPTAG